MALLGVIALCDKHPDGDARMERLCRALLVERPGDADTGRRLKALYQREKAEIEARFPKLLRKVAGYNLDHLGPPHTNAAHLLVG